MKLNEFAAAARLKVFNELRAGQEPSLGLFDPAALREASAKGEPQVGKTRFEPLALIFEFVYPDPLSAAQIVTVTQESPERIVFLPVPSWVVEQIWQGDVDGSFHFESEARALLAEFATGLEPEANLGWFGDRQPKRRE